MLDKLIMVLVCSFLLYGSGHPPMNVTTFAAIQTGAYLLTALLGTLAFVSKLGKLRFVWDQALYLSILKQSLPYATLILMMMFYYRIDGIMLSMLMDDNNLSAGIYAQSFRLLDALNIVGYLFAGLLMPMFAGMIARKEAIGGLTDVAARLLFGISMSFSILSVFHAEFIASSLYHSHTSETAAILPILIACFIPVSLTYVYGTALTAAGNLKVLNRIALIGMLVNLGLNCLLIPGYGGLGAALSGLTAQTLTALIQVVYAGNSLQVIPGRRTVIQAILFTATAILWCWGIGKLELDSSLRLATGLAGCIALLFISKLLTPQYLLIPFSKSDPAPTNAL